MLYVVSIGSEGDEADEIVSIHDDKDSAVERAKEEMKVSAADPDEWREVQSDGPILKWEGYDDDTTKWWCLVSELEHSVHYVERDKR